MFGRTRAVAPLLSLAVALFALVVLYLAPSAGALALAPAAAALMLAFATRKPALSLLVGALLGAGIASLRGGDENFAATAARYVKDVFADRDHQYIVGFTLCLGIVARGASLHLEVVLRRVFERRAGRALGAIRAQLLVWASGLVVFIDDYLNSMLVGAASRPLFDRAGLSRAKLAFLVDATAAPVSSLAPVSTWIAVELGYIAEYSTRARSHGALGVFVESIPHRFYPLLMLVFTLAGILMQREFGPMRSAPPPTPPREGLEATGYDHASWSRHCVSGVLPMAAVFVVVFAVMAKQTVVAMNAGAVDWGSALGGTNSLQALLYGAAVGALLALLLESRHVSSVVGLAVEGVRGMLQPCSILIAAWLLSATLDDLDTARQLAGYLPTGGGPAWLAGGVFLIAALTSFATGTSWGTMAILFPLALPLAHAVDTTQGLLEVSVVGAVLAGAVFGDHCSPVSDTTVISAAAAGCDIMQHVFTQLPYALVVGAIALVAHLATGYAELSPWWPLLFGCFCVIGVLCWLGKPTIHQRSSSNCSVSKPDERNTR